MNPKPVQDALRHEYRNGIEAGMTMALTAVLGVAPANAYDGPLPDELRVWIEDLLAKVKT